MVLSVWLHYWLRPTMAKWNFSSTVFLRLKYHQHSKIMRMRSHVAFKVAMNLQFQEDRIVSSIVAIECANMQVVRSVHKGRPDFALRTVVVVAVLSRVAIKVLETSFIARLMGVGNVASLRAAGSLLWGVPVCALHTEVGDVARCKGVISLHNPQQNSV